MTAQTNLFDYAPPTEQEKKKAALKKHEDNPANTRWLLDARAESVEFCRANKGKYDYPNAITTDDVRIFMGVYTKSAYDKSNNRMGVVLRCEYFRAIKGAYHRSTADGSNGNIIQVWQLKEDYL